MIFETAANAATAPIETVGPAEVEALIGEAMPEGESVEYKQRISGKGTDDPWASKREIPERSRVKLMAELCAFANTAGGRLIIGIEESDDRPRRAAAVGPVADCADLADRLGYQIRDCFDPPLAGAVCRPVMIGADRAGVVIVEIPASRLAPHRVKGDEAYMRRGEHTEVMGMRQIHDLVLQRASGMASINESFRARREAFEARAVGSPSRVWVCATLVPTTPLWVQQIARNAAVAPTFKHFILTYGKREYRLAAPFVGLGEHPILGGARFIDDGTFRVSCEVYRSGLVDFEMASMPWDSAAQLFPDWVLILLANALNVAHRFRVAAAAPSTEFALEVQVWRQGALSLMKLGSGAGADEPIGPIRPPRAIFDRLAVGSPDTFDAVARAVFVDLLNCAGFDPGDKADDFRLEPVV